MSAAPRSPVPATPPRSPRSQQRRLRILEVAAQCFARSGFARTRIDDVAAAAGVSRALVYNHFGSKEGLARAVQEHMLGEWSAAVDRALAGAKTCADALSAWLRINLADTRRRPLLAAMALQGLTSRALLPRGVQRVAFNGRWWIGALLVFGIARNLPGLEWLAPGGAL